MSIFHTLKYECEQFGQRKKDKQRKKVEQRSSKHTHKTKVRVTRTPL